MFFFLFFFFSVVDEIRNVKVLSDMVYFSEADAKKKNK